MAQQPEFIRPDVPFVLVCCDCDADGPATYEEAIREGWVNIQFDDGPGWYYLGICPECSPGYREILLSLVCKKCGREVKLASYDEAKAAGWTNVSCGPDLENPSFLGVCSTCCERRVEAES